MFPFSRFAKHGKGVVYAGLDGLGRSLRMMEGPLDEKERFRAC